LQGTSQIDATNLDIVLYCARPTNTYVRTYGTKYDFAAAAVAVATDVIDLGTTPPAADTPVMITTTGTLPAPLAANTMYYVRTVSGNTCKLASYSGSDTLIIDITSQGSGTHSLYTGHTNTATATINVLDDVTGDATWVTTADHNRTVLADAGPADYDQQRLTLSTIAAGSIILSANIDSTQYPGARIVLSSRNVSIRSAGTSASQAIITGGTGLVLDCEITNTAGSGTTFYGYGVNSGTNHTISGTVTGCSYGVNSGMVTFKGGFLSYTVAGVLFANATDIYNANVTLINTKTRPTIVHGNRNAVYRTSGRVSIEHNGQVTNAHLVQDSYGDIERVAADGIGAHPTQRAGGSPYVQEITPQSNCSAANWLDIFPPTGVRIWHPAGTARTYRWYIQTTFVNMTNAVIVLSGEYLDQATGGHLATAASTNAVTTRVNAADWSRYVEVTIPATTQAYFATFYLKLQGYESTKLLWVDPQPLIY
jgi:ribosomal protein L31